MHIPTLGSLLALTLLACGTAPEANHDDLWAETSPTYLEGERIRFRRPHRLKRSSRYFIGRDLPDLALDTG